jgi:myosin-5
MVLIHLSVSGFLGRFQELMANVIGSIRNTVKFEDIVKSSFWLSNFIEMQALMRSYKVNIHPRLLTDMECLLIDLYHSWIKELKRAISKYAIPSVIEYQGLPGFLEEGSKGYSSGFMKWVGVGPSEPISIDKMLLWMSKLNDVMLSFYMNDSIRRQILVSLIKFVGVTAFNYLLARKNYCTWRRGMQIQYNVSRIDEWCSKNDVTEGALHLEPLLQAAKLLQINKGSAEDVDIMFDMCFLLSPGQINRLLLYYQPGEDEKPVDPEIVNIVRSRCVDEVHGKIDLDVEDPPLTAPILEGATKLEKFIPQYMVEKIPLISRLTKDL